MDGDSLINISNTYNFVFTYTETVEGQLFAESLEKAKEALTAEFGHVDSFAIVSVEETEDNSPVTEKKVLN